MCIDRFSFQHINNIVFRDACNIEKKKFATVFLYPILQEA